MAPIKKPNPDDVALGAAIRQRRMLLAISQKKLADEPASHSNRFREIRERREQGFLVAPGADRQALNCSIAGLMSLAEPEDNEIAGIVDGDTLSVVRSMQATSPAKRATIRRVVVALVEGAP